MQQQTRPGPESTPKNKTQHHTLPYLTDPLLSNNSPSRDPLKTLTLNLAHGPSLVTLGLCFGYFCVLLLGYH